MKPKLKVQRYVQPEFREYVKPEIPETTAIKGDMGARVKALSSGENFLAALSSLRPLTDEDWTGEIGGVRVRAYDDADGSIRVVCADDTSLWAFDKGNNDDTVLRTLCREHDIPVMPERLHKGEYKRPEAKG